MVTSRVLSWLAGPALLLVAQVCVPGGTPDAAARLAIIQAHPDRWFWSHALFLVAFVALLPFLVHVCLEGPPSGLRSAGAWLLGAAVLSDMGIASLQLLAGEAARTWPVEQTLALLALNTAPRVAVVFLPYLGFALGGLLVALSWRRTPLEAGGMATAGVSLCAGGVSGAAPLLLLGAAALCATAVARALRVAA